MQDRRYTEKEIFDALNDTIEGLFGPFKQTPVSMFNPFFHTVITMVMGKLKGEL